MAPPRQRISAGGGVKRSTKTDARQEPSKPPKGLTASQKITAAINLISRSKLAKEDKAVSKIAHKLDFFSANNGIVLAELSHLIGGKYSARYNQITLNSWLVTNPVILPEEIAIILIHEGAHWLFTDKLEQKRGFFDRLFHPREIDSNEKMNNQNEEQAYVFQIRLYEEIADNPDYKSMIFPSDLITVLYRLAELEKLMVQITQVTKLANHQKQLDDLRTGAKHKLHWQLANRIMKGEMSPDFEFKGGKLLHPTYANLGDWVAKNYKNLPGHDG